VKVIVRAIDLKKRQQLFTAIAVAVLVGIVGVHQLFFSHAAAYYYTSAQASSGTVGGGASVITDATASDGKSVDFASSSGGSSGGGGTTQASYTVVGNSIENANGQKVLVQGVDRPSLEWSCSGSSATGSGSGIPASDFTTMRTDWNSNAVRIPLDQDRWLTNAAQYCSTYKANVEAAVNEAEAAGMIVILDLHWSDQGNLATTASGQQCMPDQNSVTFWQQMATLYKGDPNVWFELYNEPYPPGSSQSAQWNTWQNGGSVTCSALVGGNTATWNTPGMQTLVNTVRATGANNIVIAGGLSYSSNLNSVPSLTGSNVAYAIHIYRQSAGASWSTAGWDSQFGSTSATKPVIATEFGDQGCDGSQFDPQLLSYFRSHNVGYTAWAWYAGSCNFTSIITNAAGACYGATSGCAIQSDMKSH
jgi:endoglucanase